MTDVERAERHRKGRAAIFLGGAAALLLTQFAAMIGDDGSGPPFWLFLAAGLAMWLTPLIGWIGRRRPLTPLLEDELTQQHRSDSFTAGFWAAIGSAAILALVAPVSALTVAEATRVIVTAGLVAALGSFAILEARGDT